MADSDAVRSRRKRLHAANDHSACSARCDARRGLVAVAAAGDAGVDVPGSLARLARRLEAAHEADPGNAVVARVLKDTLALIGSGEPAAGDDRMDFLRELAAQVP
jgi:hypothetical protein